MDVMNPPAAVQQAEETEQQLIDRAAAALSRSSWEIGECAALWTARYAYGRTDEDFGQRIGLDGQQIRQRRAVWETFADVRDSYPCIKWSHFRAALAWDDAAECLAWANENEATVAEMNAWRRMQHGDDLTVASKDEEVMDDRGTAEGGMEPNGGMEPAGLPQLPDGIALAADQPHVADVDPHQRPPSTVVNTPRDFEQEPTRTHQPVPDVWSRDDAEDADDEPALSPEAVLMTLSTHVEKLVNSWAERRPPLTLRQKMAAKLRRLAEQMERD